MDTPPAPNPFWDFSLQAYARPGAAAACLRLQDRDGLDVNVLLYCLWRASSGAAPLTRGELRLAVTLVAAWQCAVVARLRALRRRCRARDDEDAHWGSLREALATAELAAERVEQELLCRAAGLLAAGPHPPGASAARSLRRYATLAGARPDGATASDLDALLDAVVGTGVSAPA